MTTQLATTGMNESLQPGLVALCVIFLVLSTLALSLRLWSNYITFDYRQGWDDFFAALTLPFIAAQAALILWWVHLGLGKHASTVPPADLARAPIITYSSSFLYDIAISLPKFSVLFFYRRIFEYTQTWFTVALWTIGVANAGWLIAVLISTALQCTPINAAWEPVPGAKCFNHWDWFIAVSIANIAVDIAILIIPLPILWRLQTTAFRRIMILGIFVFGYSVIVVSIGRFVTLVRGGADTIDDPTWSVVAYLKWAQCESPISLISISLPSIFRLARRIYHYGIKGAMPDRRGPLNAPSRGESDDYREFIQLENDSNSLATAKTSLRHDITGKDLDHNHR
ncbi:hypothetical protein F4777DRAFT_545477 [Nemania sp. FL0916]|nr:hypothetical protein F4777DRAFT_545477 [Nemania sp. FL0916]